MGKTVTETVLTAGGPSAYYQPGKRREREDAHARGDEACLTLWNSGCAQPCIPIEGIPVGSKSSPGRPIAAALPLALGIAACRSGTPPPASASALIAATPRSCRPSPGRPTARALPPRIRAIRAAYKSGTLLLAQN